MEPTRKYILAVIFCLAIVLTGILTFDLFRSIEPTETGCEEIAGLCFDQPIVTDQSSFNDNRPVESSEICPEHGVPESLCYFCQPELEPAFRNQGDWCNGHNVPESQCEICNPGILDQHQHRAEPPDAAGKPFSEGSYAAETFPRYKKSPASECDTHNRRVTFADSNIATQVGIQTSPAVALSLSPELFCDAVTDYDRNFYARVSAPVAGVLREVKTDLGKRANKDDVLVVIDSKEFGAAKAEFLEADICADQHRFEYERVSRLYQKKVTSQKDLLEAKTRMDENLIRRNAAKQGLINLGLAESDIARIKKGKDTSSLLSIKSPLSGVVVKRCGVTGEMISPLQPLFDIAADDKMWALLSVYEPDITKVRLGQKVLTTFPELAGEIYDGTVSWISTALDPVTRSMQVRVDVCNANGRIKAGMFGKARVMLEDNSRMTGVPVDSLQWDGCCNLVFVKVSDSIYAPRKVKIGFRSGDYYAMVSGISPGEQVVTQGSFLLKTEILKDRIGAGCCPDA